MREFWKKPVYLWLSVVLLPRVAVAVDMGLHNPGNVANSGQKVYQQYCANCHAAKPLIRIGAPSFRSTEQWASRLKQPKRQLWQHLEQGIGAMPPRGGCFDCSDDLLHEALNYMLPPAINN